MPHNEDLIEVIKKIVAKENNDIKIIKYYLDKIENKRIIKLISFQIYNHIKNIPQHIGIDVINYKFVRHMDNNHYVNAVDINFVLYEKCSCSKKYTICEHGHVYFHIKSNIHSLYKLKLSENDNLYENFFEIEENPEVEFDEIHSFLNESYNLHEVNYSLLKNTKSFQIDWDNFIILFNRKNGLKSLLKLQDPNNTILLLNELFDFFVNKCNHDQKSI